MSIKTIDAPTLKQWLANNEALLIDVREPGEYTAARITGATLIPLVTVTVAALPEAHGRKIVLHCHLGRRSLHACHQLLVDAPDLEVYNLEGGIAAWIEQGYPVDAN